MDETTFAGLETLVTRYQELVATQDRTLFDEVFASNHEVSLISIRSVYRGRESVYNDFLLGKIRAAYSSIELVRDSLEMRMASDGLVLIIFAYHTVCTRRGTGEPHGIKGMETQVAVRETDGWRLCHVHYSK